MAEGMSSSGARPKKLKIKWPRWMRGINNKTPVAIAIGVLAGLIVVSAVAGMALISVYAYYQSYELVLPGVRVGTVELGGKTYDEAQAALAAAWSEDSILLTDGRQEWRAAPAEFGLALDSAATTRRALDIGHNQDPITEMLTLASTMTDGRDVAPVVVVDTDTARTGLEAWAATIDKAPQEAGIRIEGSDVIGVPGEPGYSLNVDETLNTLLADPEGTLTGGYLPLTLDPIAPRMTDPGNAVAQAEALLAAPLALRIYDPVTDQWSDQTVQPAQIAGWLSVVNSGDGPTVEVDAARISAYLGDLNTSLGESQYLDGEVNAPILTAALEDGGDATLIISHTPTTYVVQYGDSLTGISWQVGMPYWRILEANPGLDAEGLDIGQEITIPSLDVLLPLPVVPSKRLIVDMGTQRLHVYENGTEIQTFVISTGIDRSPTQPGVFQVQTFDDYAYASVWDLYMPDFIGIYEAWPGFMNGFHGLPTLSSGRILWADVLGSPASYGCIILDLDDGAWLYDWAEAGVVVEIRE